MTYRTKEEYLRQYLTATPEQLVIFLRSAILNLLTSVQLNLDFVDQDIEALDIDATAEIRDMISRTQEAIAVIPTILHAAVDANEILYNRLIRKSYPRTYWQSRDVEIRNSAISGKGVFALRDFDKGEVIEIFGGIPMEQKEFDAFCKTAETFNAVQIDEYLHLVEPANTTQEREGSINHSCDSNLWMQDENTLSTRRPIKVGEELTVDYALFTTDLNWELNPCLCKSEHCRHTIKGDDWKLSDVQERYAGHFSPFLNKRIAYLKLTGEK